MLKPGYEGPHGYGLKPEDEKRWVDSMVDFLTRGNAAQAAAVTAGALDADAQAIVQILHTIPDELLEAEIERRRAATASAAQTKSPK